MSRIALSLVVGLTLSAAAARTALAQTSGMRFSDSPPSADLTPSQRAFANAFVPAILGRDLGRYERLIHPASLECRNKDNEDVFQEQFARRQELTAGQEPKVTVEELPAKTGFFDYMAKNGYPYPVRPTHAIHVDLGWTGKTHKSLVAFVALDGQSWYEVYPCPTTDAVTQFRAKKARDAENQLKAQELARSLRDPLRAEIMTLLNEGKTVSAIKKYGEATGVDLALAKRVVEVLQSGTR